MNGTVNNSVTMYSTHFIYPISHGITYLASRRPLLPLLDLGPEKHRLPPLHHLPALLIAAERCLDSSCSLFSTLQGRERECMDIGAMPQFRAKLPALIMKAHHGRQAPPPACHDVRLAVKLPRCHTGRRLLPSQHILG